MENMLSMATELTAEYPNIAVMSNVTSTNVTWMGAPFGKSSAHRSQAVTSGSEVNTPSGCVYLNISNC